jgi:hypothetical protein
VSKSEEIKSREDIVSDLLKALLKAKKNIRLYPSNNPLYKKTVEDIYRKFREFFELYNRLELRIGRNEISFDGEPVFRGEGKEDNLALLFFRDGLRELAFEEGLEEEELQGFLEILSVDFDSEEVEDDIVTLLWEKDFPHVGYKVDETVLVEDEDYEDVATEQAQTGSMEEDNIKQAYEDASRAENAGKVAVMPLEEEDLKALFKLVERDSGDKTEKFTDLLFDMLNMSESVEDYRIIVRILTGTVEHALRKDNLKSAVDIFGRTKNLIENSDSDDVKKNLSIVLSYAGTSVPIKLIGAQIDSGDMEEKLFAKYISFLGVNAIPPFIELLGEMKTIAGRKYAINALVVLGRKDLNWLVRSLRDGRWYVVRNMVYILRKIGEKRAVENIAKMVEHEDARVRKEALRALGELGGEGVLEIISDGLGDTDLSVRIAAGQALGSLGSEPARMIMFDFILGKRFLNEELQEMKGFFEVLSRWNDETVADFLMSLLRKSPVLKRGKHNELKAAAVYCLGLMGNRDSLEMLARLRDSKSRVISEHAYAAMKRIEYGR